MAIWLLFISNLTSRNTLSSPYGKDLEEYPELHSQLNTIQLGQIKPKFKILYTIKDKVGFLFLDYIPNLAVYNSSVISLI